MRWRARSSPQKPVVHHFADPYARHVAAARYRGAKAPLSGRGGKRRSLVPGLFGAELRIGPGVTAVPGGVMARSLCDQRTEDLVVQLRVRVNHCMLLARTDPDARRRAGHHLLHHGHEGAGRGSAGRSGRRMADRKFGEIFLTDVRILAEDTRGRRRTMAGAWHRRPWRPSAG